MTTYYIRQSELKKFKNCRRSAWLSYKRGGYGYELAADEVKGQRNVGSLVHSALETYYTGGDPVEFITQELHSHAGELGLGFTKEHGEVYNLARIMIQGYIQWLGDGGYDANETTLYVEKQLEVPIGRVRGDDVILTGRIDRIVQDNLTGEIIIEDHKTVSAFNQVGQRLQLDDQGLLYAILVQGALNLPVRRFRHNMLKRVKRTAAAKPPFYERYEVSFNEKQLESAWTHTSLVVDRMVESLQTLAKGEMYHHIAVEPNPSRENCQYCDFVAVCPLLDDGSDWRGMLEDTGIYRPREVPTI